MCSCTPWKQCATCARREDSESLARVIAERDAAVAQRPASAPFAIGDVVRSKRSGKIKAWTGAATAPGARFMHTLDDVLETIAELRTSKASPETPIADVLDHAEAVIRDGEIDFEEVTTPEKAREAQLELVAHIRDQLASVLEDEAQRSEGAQRGYDRLAKAAIMGVPLPVDEADVEPGDTDNACTTAGAAWKRGQHYGLVRAAAEARIAGHVELSDMLLRAAATDLHDRPEGVRSEDWDLEARPTPTVTREGLCEGCSWPNVSRLRSALERAREVIALCSTRVVDAPEDDAVMALGRAIGFGAVMSAASKTWAAWLVEQGMPAGSNFTAGPCLATVEKALEEIDAALATSKGGRT